LGDIPSEPADDLRRYADDEEARAGNSFFEIPYGLDLFVEGDAL
jgi:hypothetical protein